MKKIFELFIAFTFIVVFLGCNSSNDDYLMSEDNPISQSGTISFILETDKTYRNGVGQDNFSQELFKLPGLATCILSRTNSNVDILFTLDGEDNYEHCIHIRSTEIHGPERYFLLITWDAEIGMFDGYLNGGNVRYPGIKFDPWTISGQAATVDMSPGQNVITDLKVTSRYLPRSEVSEQVPSELLGQNPEVLALDYYSNPKNVEDKRGELLYASNLDNESRINDWILEGPGKISFEEGRMIMTSEKPDSEEGHFNVWCPMDIPDSFILEWEYEPLRDLGFNHIFFSAKGLNGEDIFDPALPERDGTFGQYLNGAIHNYFIAYYAHLPNNVYGRTFGYLQKNPNFYMLNHGPTAIPPGGEGIYKLQLIKSGEHIQLSSNGKVCIDYTDNDTERFGAALSGGKIGFRQMSQSIGAYSNFRIWKLKN